MTVKYYHIECGVTDSEGRELPWDDDEEGPPVNPDPPLRQMEHGGNIVCSRCGGLFCGERTRCPFCRNPGTVRALRLEDIPLPIAADSGPYTDLVMYGYFYDYRGNGEVWLRK